jgi:hypothetical protein
MEHSRALEANSSSAFQEFATCVYSGPEDQIHVLAIYYLRPSLMLYSHLHPDLLSSLFPLRFHTETRHKYLSSSFRATFPVHIIFIL